MNSSLPLIKPLAPVSDGSRRTSLPAAPSAPIKATAGGLKARYGGFDFQVGRNKMTKIVYTEANEKTIKPLIRPVIPKPVPRTLLYSPDNHRNGISKPVPRTLLYYPDDQGNDIPKPMPYYPDNQGLTHNYRFKSGQRDEKMREMFEKWMMCFNKVYTSAEEKERRYAIFEGKVRFLENNDTNTGFDQLWISNYYYADMDLEEEEVDKRFPNGMTSNEC